MSSGKKSTQKSRRIASSQEESPEEDELQFSPSLYETSRRSTRCDEDPLPNLDNKLLIHLVEERPSLWDPKHPKHADRQHTPRMWREIAEQLCENWVDLLSSGKKACVTKIVTQWHSIRDRFIRDCHKDEQARSGTGAKRNRAYQYEGMLQFLRPTAGLRQIHSSTLNPVALPDEPVQEQQEPMRPTVPRSPPRDNAPPLSVTRASGQTPRGRVSVSNRLGEFVRRPGDHGRTPQDLDTLTRLIRDALASLEALIDRRWEESIMLRRLEGAGPSNPTSSNYYFFLSLLQWMEDMTPEENYECRTRVNQIVWEIRNRSAGCTRNQTSDPPAPATTTAQAPLTAPTQQTAYAPAYTHPHQFPSYQYSSSTHPTHTTPHTTHPPCNPSAFPRQP